MINNDINQLIEYVKSLDFSPEDLKKIEAAIVQSSGLFRIEDLSKDPLLKRLREEE